MARRRYRKVTSGSGKSHQGRRNTMAQPVSSIIGDLVKSSRSIAHSDDFEGFKLIQTNSRQLILLDLNIIILMSCVAWPNQTPIGAASNFLQRKWVSCSKSYRQGYDLGWYKDMEPLVFRNHVYCWRDYEHRSFHCGRKAWQVLSVLRLRRLRRLLCLFRLAPSCAVLRRLAPSCAVLRRLRRLARWWRWWRWWAQRNNRAMRPQCFIPTSQKHSLSPLVSKRASEQASKQQQASSRWAAGKQQQAAASSSKEQQAAGKQQVSSRWAAAGKQQQAAASSSKQKARSNQRLPPWNNDQI